MRPIYTFVRHCNISANSLNKQRPSWFTKEKTLFNLLETKDEYTHVTILLDTASGCNDPTQHFSHALKQKKLIEVIPIHGGTDAHSFRNLLDHVCSLILPPDAIIYLLEDDYVHQPNWPNILREGFNIPNINYVTLYDHPDKYTQMYAGLTSQIYATPSCHWRSIPSTTNTYACLFNTLVKNKIAHEQFSDLKIGFTFDHAKFLHLSCLGQQLISCIPAHSTHVENGNLSPCVEWNILKD